VTRAPTQVPLPLADAVSGPFWTACAERRLVIQHCLACGIFQSPPRLLCRNCRGGKFDWCESAGNGRVYTYTVVHHPAVPALSDEVPYVVVVVKLDDCGGALLTSNLVGQGALDVAVDRAVHLQWDFDTGVWLPRFELVAADDCTRRERRME
jgi:uncharacterized OB-fold protein